MMPDTAGDSLAQRATGIRLLILDVDGVLTDGSIILDGSGNEIKAFHVRDGHGIKMAQRAGIAIAIITGRTSSVVERRATELGITEVHQGCRDKVAAYAKVLEKTGLTAEETAYMGDDIVDIPLLVRVGLPVAVADADEAAKRKAMFVTRSAGGRGAVREVTDLLLKSRGLLDGIVEKYSEV